MALPIAPVVAGSLIDPTAFGNAVVDALNAAPRGYVGHTALATSFTQSTGTVADLTGLSVTFTAVAGRRYKVTLFMPHLSRPSGVAASVEIATSGGTVLNSGTVDGSTADVAAPATVLHIGTFSAGSTTLKARLANNGGAGTITASARGGVPFLLVEDIGT